MRLRLTVEGYMGNMNSLLVEIAKRPTLVPLALAEAEAEAEAALAEDLLAAALAAAAPEWE